MYKVHVQCRVNKGVGLKLTYVLKKLSTFVITYKTMDIDGEFEKRAVCVTVNQSRRIVTGLDWSTTAQDLIRSIRPRSEPQVLLESWRDCMRPIGKNEYVCQILEQWGEEARNVQLVLMSTTSYAEYQSRPGLLRNKIYLAQTHGKVAGNKKKRLSRCSFPKKKVVCDIERLMEAVRMNKERLKALEEPVKQGMLPEVYKAIKYDNFIIIHIIITKLCFTDRTSIILIIIIIIAVKVADYKKCFHKY